MTVRSLLSLTIVTWLVIVGVLVIAAGFIVKPQVIQFFVSKNYCSEEILNQLKNSNDTSPEKVQKYFDCQPLLIFLRDDINEAEIETFKADLTRKAGVYKVTYNSKQDALKAYKDLNRNDPALIEFIDEAFLPATFEVYVNNPKNKNNVAEFANQKKFVQKTF
jgi:hypothetical protein